MTQSGGEQSERIIQILLVDDHTMVREGFRQLIVEEDDMAVAGEASSGREAIELVQQLDVDVVLMDIVMPEMNGVEATHQILKANPDIRVIGLSIYTDQQYVINMLRNGASGYVLKNARFEELSRAIRTVVDGQLYLSESIPRTILQKAIGGEVSGGGSGELDKLTHRERQVLQLLAEGKKTSEIAEILEIGVKTVGTYRWRMMQKLDLSSNAELTQFAIRHGLIKLE